MSIPTATLTQLRDIAGPAGSLEDAQLIEPYLVDHRKLYHGSTPLVLRPDSTERVAAIMRLCYEHGIGVVPVGGNTSYCGGATPSADGSQVVLSLARMRRIRSLDPLNYTLTAEAGCTLAEVQSAAASMDRYFPLSLGSEGTCQLGGNLSTNAGGTAVLRYGMARDLCLGLEVVLPDGRVLDELKGLRKNNTGYDLRDLFIGAEGTLGVITAAVCKVFPEPKSIVTALVAVPDPQSAVDLLAYLRGQTGDGLNTFELIPRLALDLVLRYIPDTVAPLEQRSEWYVLLEASTGRSDPQWNSAIENTLADAMERGYLTDAAIAQSGVQREQFWRLRETIPEAQSRLGPSLKHDISVTTSQLPSFIREGTQLMHEIIPNVRPVTYGHLGDGNLHFNASLPEHGDAAEFARQGSELKRAIHDLVARYGGSFSAEHGIGQLKRAELERYKSPVAVDLMRAIKHALDPKGIMNPGKVVS
ncbi:MAG TPA: FAD-binding oxidoreductase [Steroidobacteraceae bacterium]|nr:FAD-binding oxidoreductase [Steroidobacteraceae bacterium]